MRRKLKKKKKKLQFGSTSLIDNNPFTEADLYSSAGGTQFDLKDMTPKQETKPEKTSGFGSPSTSQFGAAIAQGTAGLGSYLSSEDTSPNYNKKFEPTSLQKEQQLDQSLNSAVSALGPWWGALASVGQGVSQEVQGDDYSNVETTTLATQLDPFWQFKALDQGGEEAAYSFLLPGKSALARAERLEKEQQMFKQTKLRNKMLEDQARINQAQSFEKGGKIKKRGNRLYALGGQLEAISEDAVQVKANNPSQVDSVELPQAFVDHNEVIDKDLRVFSDSIKAPSGRSIAKEAARLEKMKTDKTGFDGYNDMIDAKLDRLFTYQETSKKPAMKKGGKLKSAYQPGGIIEDDMLDPHFTEEEMADFTSNPSLVTDEKTPINWSRVGTNAAAFAPNIANMFLQSRLAGPPDPILERKVNLDRLRADDQLAANTSAFRQAQKLLTSNTQQGSNFASSLGSMLAKRFESSNQILGELQRSNAAIQAQEAGMNVGIGARNAERIQKARENRVDFRNKKLQMTSQNIASASEKLQQMGRERNLQDRDLLELAIIKEAYKDSGVYNRAYSDLLDKYLKTYQGGSRPSKR